MVRRLLLIVCVCAACVVSAAADAGRAVPFPASLSWYNVSHPLTLAELRGRAVLLDFFTPGCVNCIQMIPVERALELTFGPHLVVIGIDSPDDSAAASAAGLHDFIRRYSVRNPLVLDSKLRLWRAYGVQAWPTLVLVGPAGDVRERFVGERSFEALLGPITAVLKRGPTATALPPLPVAPMAVRRSALETPEGIAVSPDLVAIADSGHNRIVLANHQGVVQAVIGSGCIGDGNGSYAHATFYRPHGLAFHDGSLYVADTWNQLLRRVDLRTRSVSTFAGMHEAGYVNTGHFRATAAVLDSPWGLAWYGNRLYVSMGGDHDIWRYDPASRSIGPWAGTGREGLRDGRRGDAEFAQPSGLSLEGNTLYDVDPESHSVRAIDLPAGRVRTLIGSRTGQFRYGLRNGLADRALLQHDEGIVADGSSLYIADTFNNALRRLDLRTHRVSTVAANLERPIAVAMLNPATVLVAEGVGNQLVAVQVPSGKVSPWRLKGLAAPDTSGCAVP